MATWKGKAPERPLTLSTEPSGTGDSRRTVAHTPKAPLHGSGDEAELDSYNLLRTACEEYEEYPYNLLRQIPKHLARDLWTYTQDNDEVLFRGDKARLVFWEHWNGEGKYHETEVSELKDMQNHLYSRQADPHCRHVFIESDHSRAPLNCTAAMLKYLMTYHQVDVSLLDCIFAFGDQEEPVDAGLSQFQYDNAWSRQSRLHSLMTTLGRSGREWRFSILLRTVERIESDWPWSMRQAALYHSFDVVTGKTLWISIKGNACLKNRFKEATSGLVSAYTEPIDELSASLRASLESLVILFTWCEENWRWYIRDIDTLIQAYLIKAKTAPIDKKPHFSRVQPATRLSGQNSQTSRPEGSEELVLEMFNYGDLHELSVMGDKVEDAILTIKLNKKVLEDTRNFYLALRDEAELPSNTASLLRSGISAFLQKTEAIIRKLDTQREQLESLSRKQNEGKTLFTNLIQHRKLQVRAILAELAHIQQKIKQKIADRTSSMPVIITSTIMFLPAIFVATFFQSGVLGWNVSDYPGTATKSWFVRVDAMALFLEVVLPLVLVPFLGLVGIRLVKASRQPS